jgi:lipoprotein-anchoring transpeptidase ErfK/SrfK
MQAQREETLVVISLHCALSVRCASLHALGLKVDRCFHHVTLPEEPFVGRDVSGGQKRRLDGRLAVSGSTPRGLFGGGVGTSHSANFSREPTLPPTRSVVYESPATGPCRVSAFGVDGGGSKDRDLTLDRCKRGQASQPGHGMVNSAQSTAVKWRWGPAIVTLAAMAALTALTVGAAARQVRPAPTEAAAPRDAGQPIMAIVSIKSQQVTFYDADGWILRAPVSTGITGRETPAGVFAVIEKNKDHHSTLYDDAWMPNMQRITWNGIALHGGPLPGYAASHGCVRMPFDFAEMLFDKTWIGMRVIISPNDAAPVEFSHPALFVPNAAAVAAAPARAETLAGEAAEAAKTADEAKKAAATAAREAASLTTSLRKLESLKIRADAERASVDKALAAAKTDQARARAEDLKQKAAPKAAEAATQFDAAKAEATSTFAAAAAAKDAAKAAETKKADAAKAANEAKLALEPVSVYISRATQKLYVRRNTHKPWPDGGEVFDASIEASVTIRNPDKPIGTHVFTAVARNGAGLSWTAVTIDNGDDAKDAPTALPRSSIIVSDEPLSRETNYRTEFVAVLNNQPQGGFLMRRPTPHVLVASNNVWGGFGSFFQPNWDSQSGNTRRRGGPYYPQVRQGWWLSESVPGRIRRTADRDRTALEAKRPSDRIPQPPAR